MGKIKEGQVYVYEGEGHAFMNSDPDSFKRMDSETLQPRPQVLNALCC